MKAIIKMILQPIVFILGVILGLILFTIGFIGLIEIVATFYPNEAQIDYEARNTVQKIINIEIKELHAKIGELTLENDFLSGALGKAGLLSAKR